MSQRYEVHVYFDGPQVFDDSVIQVVAEDENDAVREAIVAVGVPKIGEVRKI